MTKIIPCSRCQATLSLPEVMYGKWVRCPQCHEAFEAPRGDAKAAADDGAFQADKPRALPVPAEDLRGMQNYRALVRARLDDRDRNQAWSAVKSGLKMLQVSLKIAGAGLLIYAAIFLGVAIFFDLLGPWFENKFIPIEKYVGPLALLTACGGVGYVLGLVKCFAAPRSSRTELCILGHGLCLATVSYLCFTIAHNPSFWHARHALEIMDVAVPLALLCLAAVACVLFFAWFLMTIAEQFPAKQIAWRRYLWFQIVWLQLLTVSLGITLMRANQFTTSLQFAAEEPVTLTEMLAWLIWLAIVGVGGGLESLLRTLRLLRAVHEMIEADAEENRV